MSIVKEVAETLDELAKLIENTHSIIKAINDGREYLALKYPDARDDFANLLTQMQKTVIGLARVTGVIKSFRFTVGSQKSLERSLERFNKHMIKHDVEVAALRGDIRKLKSDCKKIGDLRDKLTQRSRGQSWSRMFNMLGIKSRQKRDHLVGTIGNFYADDQRMIFLINKTLKLATRVLADVDRSLGMPGQANPNNVPKASIMLGIYAGMFLEPHEKLESLADDMNEAANSLMKT